MSHMLKIANSIYREKGLRGLASSVAYRLDPRNPYQTKLAASMDVRWRMIESVIPPDSHSLLDIGSNLGDFTARAAGSGLWSIGIEKSRRLTAKAQRRHEGTPRCAFMWSDLRPADCASLPDVDVTLILSVHHHWYQAYGADAANRMLQDIVSGTRRVAVFEGPSRTHRYGDRRPEFIDNDETSVTAYYDTLLQRVLGARVARVLPLGKTACVGEREPYRWMYALIRP